MKQMCTLKRVFGAIVMALAFAGVSIAEQPLITDDTGTQGKGKFQLETSFEQEHEEGGGYRENESQFRLAITYGVVDKVDIICTVPFLYVRTKDYGIKSTNSGVSDVTLETKWRFHESDGLSFAIKPGLSVPSGDCNAGLGAGKVGGSLFLIATKEIEPFAFHFNAGYIRNENDVDEGPNVWHVSLASEWKTLNWLKVVGNLGTEGGRDAASDIPEGFIIGGLIFLVSERIDLDLGLKGIFAESIQGYCLLAGATFRF